jgi:hypothetical protein
MAANSVAKVLRASAELHALRERLDAIELLQRLFRSVAPGDLAKASRVCAIEGTTVVIAATSGPVATALRQVAPRLLTAIRKGLKENENPQLTGIRVEVQVDARPARRAVKAREPLPVDKLSQLAEELSDSPLKETLRKMGGAARNQSKRTREKT